ncbi:SDR family NAD(P)-dependent oxidoreductase [Alteribacillus sp. HJP-4]|uniref:SDR family NAD(P)-dependent oxidoreductase n=1 Tax=Alteribacillus sp. HJP-4 TaxID=2775394 RepID=UPI0035CD3272
MKIDNKTAVITGAGTGIGRATALKLAEQGANIVLNYSRSKEEAEKTLREIESFGVKAFTYKADVSKVDEVEAMCKEAVDQFGSIDILINNAGATNFVELDDLDGMLEEYWDNTFNINVKGSFFVSRACAEELKKNEGCIINITSIAGLNGAGSSMAYAASKAAGISITKSFARVLAPHVRVNSVAPGIVNTRWVDGKDEHIKKFGENTPLGRVADPEDIGSMVLGIIQGGDFVTGQTIVVDGGWTL